MKVGGKYVTPEQLFKVLEHEHWTLHYFALSTVLYEPGDEKFIEHYMKLLQPTMDENHFEAIFVNLTLGNFVNKEENSFYVSAIYDAMLKRLCEHTIDHTMQKRLSNKLFHKLMNVFPLFKSNKLLQAFNNG